MPRSAILLLALVLAAPVGRAEDPSPPVAWTAAYYEGYARARAEGKPICLVFSAVWSPRSRAFQSGPLQDPAVQEALRPYVCVRIDMDGDFLTPGRFGVKGLPGVRLLDRDEKGLLEVQDTAAPALADALRRGYEEFLKRP